jgi:hypothetical protein
MAFNISKTDQVLVLLNRLAVQEGPAQFAAGEREHLLRHPQEEDVFSDPHSALDLEDQTSRRWSSTAQAPSARRQSQGNQPEAALRIVLGDQRDSIARERKLR